MRTNHPLVMLMRLLAAVQIVLGIGFWNGYWYSLVKVHMAVGSIFVLTLWAIAILALAGRRSTRLAAAAIVWGLVVAWFGMAQRGLMIGDYHWIIRILHLVIAMASMPFAERLTAKPIVARLAADPSPR